MDFLTEISKTNRYLQKHLEARIHGLSASSEGELLVEIKRRLKAPTDLEEFGDLAELYVLMTYPQYSRYHSMGRKDRFASQEGHTTYIPYPVRRFMRIILEVTAAVGLQGKFIDVGCGIGDKVLLADAFSYLDGYGIEYEDQTYWLSQTFLPRKLRPQIFHTDAKEFDFSGYNLIYLYCPIFDGNSIHKLYRRILDTMDNGAVMLEVHAPFLNEAGFLNEIGVINPHTIDHRCGIMGLQKKPEGLEIVAAYH